MRLEGHAEILKGNPGTISEEEQMPIVDKNPMIDRVIREIEHLPPARSTQERYSGMTGPSRNKPTGFGVY